MYWYRRSEANYEYNVAVQNRFVVVDTIWNLCKEDYDESAFAVRHPNVYLVHSSGSNVVKNLQWERAEDVKSSASYSSTTEGDLTRAVPLYTSTSVKALTEEVQHAPPESNITREVRFPDTWADHDTMAKTVADRMTPEFDVEATAKEKALAMIAVRQKNDAEIMKAGANANVAVYQEPAQRSALAADSDEPDWEEKMAAASAEAKQILAEATEVLNGST